MLTKKLLTVLAAALLAATPFSSAMADDNVIRLGVVGAHSGDNAGYGLPELNAAKLVVDKINAQGGINGKQVVIIAVDDQCKPDLGINAATKVVADDLRIVMGHTCSGATESALPMYNDKKIISVSPSATDPRLTQENKFPYFFRTTPTDDAQARLGVDFSLQALGAKKIAILHDKGSYGKGYADFVQKFIKDNGQAEVVFFEGITPGGMNYTSVLQKIKRSGADTLIFGGYYPEASKLVLSMKDIGLKINFVSEDGVKTEAFLKLAGDAANGVYASSSRDYSHLPLTQEAFQAHRDTFGAEPGQFFELAYAATLTLLNAVEKAGGDQDPDAIAKALREEYVETPIGKIRFNDIGDCEGAGFSMFQVIDGKFVDQQFEAAK